MADSDSTTTFVYFITADFEHVKIGVTNDLMARLRELQTAHYQEIHLLYTIECRSREHAFELEAALHSFYRAAHVKNEWFKISMLQMSTDINFMMLLSGNTTIRQHARHHYLFMPVPYVDVRDLMNQLTSPIDMPLPPGKEEGGHD